jgi:hypothetical protein
VTHERAERRRDERRRAYVEFLTVTSNVAHRLGNLAPSDYGDPATDVQAAANAFDADVTPVFRLIEVVGSEPAVRSARELRERLREFRDGMTLADVPPAYESPEYDAIYRPVFEARAAFVDVVRAEVQS